MTKITKAIIPVAGWGTRRLPITKAVEKCMLPVGNRPIVDYSVEDCVRAGITDIYFVVSDGSTQVKAYYDKSPKLEEYLTKNGKTHELSLINQYENINFHYINQNLDGKYGTAVPVAAVLAEIGVDEPVVVIMGDDFIYRPDGGSEIGRLVKQYREGEAIMLGVPVADDEKNKYGFLELNGDKLVRIAEAVTIDQAPSNLINVSRYVMPPKLLQAVVDFSNSEIQSGEYYITTVPFDKFMADGGTVRVIAAEGQYLDGGSLRGWLHANEVVGQNQKS
jgi:UTP--glucose-1-phosphate uridylyltransferase